MSTAHAFQTWSGLIKQLMMTWQTLTFPVNTTALADLHSMIMALVPNSTRPLRYRRRRHAGALLHLLQAEAEGEGSDDGGTAGLDVPYEESLGDLSPGPGGSGLASAEPLNGSSAPPAFELQVVGNAGGISGLHGCCEGLADNVRPTIPVRWDNVPFGADSLLLLVDDMDHTLDGRTFPLVLSIVPDIDHHAELHMLESEYHPPGWDVDGLWKGTASCDDVEPRERSWRCRAWNWFRLSRRGGTGRSRRGASGTPAPPTDHRLNVALYHVPSISADVSQRGARISVDTGERPMAAGEKYDVRMGGAAGVGTIAAEGAAGHTLKRVPCALRLQLFQLDWHTREPRWLPYASRGCTVKVEAASAYDGRYKELFSRHVTHGYFARGGAGAEWLIDLGEYVDTRIELRLSVRGSDYADKGGAAWVHRLFDWCVVHRPALVCEGTQTLDLVSSLREASTTIRSGGRDVEVGRGAEPPACRGCKSGHEVSARAHERASARPASWPHPPDAVAGFRTPPSTDGPGGRTSPCSGSAARATSPEAPPFSGWRRGRRRARAATYRSRTPCPRRPCPQSTKAPARTRGSVARAPSASTAPVHRAPSTADPIASASASTRARAPPRPSRTGRTRPRATTCTTSSTSTRRRSGWRIQ